MRFVLSVFRGFQVAVYVFSTNGRLIALSRGGQICMHGTPRIWLEFG